jgi:probable HAF family extracellular repeat protein
MTLLPLIALVFEIGPLAQVVHADPLYHVTDLGAIWVSGLTNSGQALGSASIGGNNPFLYYSYGPNAGQEIPIPLGAASAVSDNGLVAGQTAVTPVDGLPRSVLYNSNTPTAPTTPLPTNLPGTGTTLVPAPVNGLNDAGQAVGAANTLYPNSAASSERFGPQHAFLSSGGKATDLGTLGGSSSAAMAINNAGQVVGTASAADGTSHAFLYSNGKMTDLGAVSGSSTTVATAINASGLIVGYGTNAQNNQGSAFLYSNGTMTNLGSLTGASLTQALGVNSAGIIIGTSGGNAFVYQNGVMTNLNSLIPTSSDFHLNTAYYVNDAGQIIVTGVDARGVVNEYLLTPSGMPAPVSPVLTGSAIPEPSTLLFAGLVGILAWARWALRR